MLKKKKERRRKILLNEIIYKTIYIAIKLLSLFKKKKNIRIELNYEQIEETKKL